MTTCRDCQAEIAFALTARGRWQTINADGVPHAATCPARQKARPPAGPDTLCAACGSDNVERSPGTGPHFGSLRCHDCNAHRWLRKPQETPS